VPELVVISGKGGTGKTTVLGSFAVMAKNKVLADADVDAPNLHLLLAPENVSERDYSGASLAVVAEDMCIQCGRCEEVCQFAAIKDHQVDDRRCEGCGTCAVVCPAQAITMRPQTTGRVYVSRTRYGLLVHARLLAGAEASGKLVTEVRRLAQEVAEESATDLILTDGSPGIGCPVIASLTGVDAALAVTEPTPSGLHDLERVLQVALHFGVPAAVCVNKWDINPELTQEIERLAEGMGADLAGRLPFDEQVAEATAEGVPLVEWGRGEASRAVEAVWHKLASDGLVHR
jgi:MinD superfamily P-loop ATPase